MKYPHILTKLILFKINFPPPIELNTHLNTGPFQFISFFRQIASAVNHKP